MYYNNTIDFTAKALENPLNYLVLTLQSYGVSILDEDKKHNHVTIIGTRSVELCADDKLMKADITLVFFEFFSRIGGRCNCEFFEKVNKCFSEFGAIGLRNGSLGSQHRN